MLNNMDKIKINILCKHSIEISMSDSLTEKECRIHLSKYQAQSIALDLMRYILEDNLYCKPCHCDRDE